MKVLGREIYWPPLRPGDTAGILLVLVLVTVIVIALSIFPMQTRTIQTQRNFGFGPDWDCAFPGSGGPVCVKSPTRLPAPQMTVNH